MTTTAIPSLTEEEYAARWVMALHASEHGKLRSVQTDGGLLGASDFGGCKNKAAYTIKRTQPSNVVHKGSAMIGTALHAAFLEQQRTLNPDLLVESELMCTLPSGRQVPVHPDLLDPNEPSVTDAKFVKDLDYRRKAGLSPQQQMQRHLYGLAMIQAGMACAESLVVRNVFVSMTDATDVWVQQQMFDPAWVDAAQEWVADVVYAVEHDLDAERDANPFFCSGYCPFFDICKPPLLDAAGELTSPTLRERALTAFEARQQRKHWEKVEKQAVEELRGVSGRVGDVQVVSTWVNSGSGYYKTDLAPVRKVASS